MEGEAAVSAPDLDPWQVSLDGLVVGTRLFELVSLSGAEQLPDVVDDDVPIMAGDGEYQGVDRVTGRTLELDVEVAAEPGTTLAQALAAWQAVTRPRRDVEVWALLPHWDAPRCTVGRVRRRSMPTDQLLGVGLARAAVQIRCADPLWYSEDLPLVGPFPSVVGGLRYPLYTDGTAFTGHLVTGQVQHAALTVPGAGTAEVWPWFEITGPTPPGGFALVTSTGQRVQWEAEVPAGAVLRLDAADGSVLLDGVADRGAALTWRDWWPVRPGEQVELVFVPLGPRTDATLAVHSPAGWW